MEFKRFIWIAVWGAMLLAMGCVKSPDDGTMPDPDLPDGKVRLQLVTTGGEFEKPVSPATRVGKADEDALETTPWVLIFADEPGEDNDIFVEAVRAVVMSGKSYVELTKTDQNRRLLIIANIESFRSPDDPEGSSKPLDKTNIEALLKNEVKNKTFQFASQNLLTPQLASPQTTVPYVGNPIPVSAERTVTKIDKNTVIGTAETPVLLRRVAAKVTVDNTAAGFTLAGVTVVNAPRHSTLCRGTAEITAAASRVDYLIFLSGDGVTGISPAKAKDGADGQDTSADPIYIYEDAAYTSVDGNTLSLIVKGEWDGNPDNYYRLVFRDEDMSSIAVERNKHYRFDIKSVVGRGYATVAEARSNPPANLCYDVSVTDQTSFDMIDNGQYYLGVSNSEIIVYSSDDVAEILAFTVTTDAPADVTTREINVSDGGGLSIVSPADSKISVAGSPTATEVKIKVESGFAFETQRTITLKLGNIVKKIVVRREPSLAAPPASKEFATDYVSGKITAGGDWLTLGTENNALEGRSDVTRPDQAGSVYLFSKSNVQYSGAVDRTGGEAYLTRHNESGTVKLYVGQKALNYGDDSPAVIDNSYVGTFHRWNQTGERLIRIYDTSGAWTATVISGDFIKLDKGHSESQFTADPGVSFTNETAVPADMNDPAKDALYQVSGNATSVSGNANASDPYIRFRVGLTGTLSSADAKPRYGVIKLSYSNYTKNQIIYVRQGEAPDYVMRPEDPLNSDGVVSDTRPFARKISPFNMSDPWRGTGGSNITDHNEIPVNDKGNGRPFDPRKFTDYPSQNGYLFQWNRPRAYHPTNSAGAISGWANTYENLWSNDREVCPNGYHHPNDGVDTFEDGYLSSSFEDSELRLSFFLKPKKIVNSESPENSVAGYYADGFFDRRKIITITEWGSRAVSVNNCDIAYEGRLFYNPITMASIFMPFGNFRHAWSGMIVNYDKPLGLYPSSTVRNSSSESSTISAIENFRNFSKTALNLKYVGMHVRCVADE